MNIKLVTALTMLAISPALSQGQGAPQSQGQGAPQQGPQGPKVATADVQKAVSEIKADKDKMATFCELQKLDAQIDQIAQKYTDPQKAQNDTQIQSLENQEGALITKLGPDFQKIAASGGNMDEDAGKMLDDLTASCPK